MSMPSQITMAIKKMFFRRAPTTQNSRTVDFRGWHSCRPGEESMWKDSLAQCAPSCWLQQMQCPETSQCLNLYRRKEKQRKQLQCELDDPEGKCMPWDQRRCQSHTLYRRPSLHFGSRHHHATACEL